jgi:hypothetical protein
MAYASSALSFMLENLGRIVHLRVLFSKHWIFKTIDCSCEFVGD